ncbi:helix-turn-helix domain-containing protein [Luteimicrobium album]
MEQLAAQGVPFRLIADEVGVSKSTVSRVLQRNTPTLEGVPA